jgi:hypothetical protein
MARFLLSVLLLRALLIAATMVSATESPLSIDTPMMQLLADPQTRPVVEKRLPQLAKRPLEDQEAAAFLGSSSPRELAADRHVRGITEEILKALQADLLAAQKSQD